MTVSGLVLCAIISERESLIPVVGIESGGVIKMRKEPRVKGAGGRRQKAEGRHAGCTEGTLSH